MANKEYEFTGETRVVNGVIPVPTAEESSAVGNAAALREAAATVYNVLEKLRTFTLHIGDIGHKREFNHLVCLAKNRLDAALSAPARNCDRFADELDAQLAFLNEVWLISVDRETMLVRDKYENWTDEMRKRYGRWLLAPAAEQKGEGDGR